MRKHNISVIYAVCLAVLIFSCSKTTEPEKRTAAPKITPPTGRYDSGQTVSIICNTTGATIRYTLDGSEPSGNSAIYITPLTINGSATVKARAYKEGLEDSPVSDADYIIGDITPGEMVFVPGGTFTMGDTRKKGSGFDELPTHQVTLSPYYIGKYQVTQQEWVEIMGDNPSHNTGDLFLPVDSISWYSAIVYCNRRSIREGLTPAYAINNSVNPDDWGEIPSSHDIIWDALNCNWDADGYRLPTEAEWEYAARGATNDPDYLFSGSNDIYTVSWFWNNSDTGNGITTQPVATKAPNGLLLYDMSGNVWEWCWDRYDAGYTALPKTNPIGPATGNASVIRGGAYSFNEYCSRVSVRFWTIRSYGAKQIGLRVVRSV